MTGPVQTYLEKTGPQPSVLSECQSDSSGDNIHELAAAEHGLYYVRPLFISIYIFICVAWAPAFCGLVCVWSSDSEEVALHHTCIIILLVLHGHVKLTATILTELSTQCPTDICTCKKGIVKCVNRGLDYIPPLPKDTIELDFSHNILNSLDKSTFNNISGIKIRKLSVSNCNITDVAEDAFFSMRTILALDMSGNMLDFNLSTLSVGLRGLNKSNIKSLNLSAQKSFNPFIKNDAFDGLSGTTIQSIVLRDGHLRQIDGKLVSKLKCLVFFDLSNNDIIEANFKGFNTLQRLDISSNELTNLNIPSGLDNLIWLNVSDNYVKDVQLRKLKSLRGLDLSENEMFTVPSFCDLFNSTYVPNLKYLNMTSNHISELWHYEENRNCLPNVRKLLLSFNPIGIFRSKQFFSMKNLESVDLNPILVTRLLIEKQAFSSKNLKQLAIGVFKQVIVKEQIQMFENCSALKKLVLNGFKFNKVSDQDLSTMFRPIKHITSLSILHSDLKYIPSVISSMSQIGILRLDSNFISHWEENTFRSLTNLKKIDLSSNAITVINQTSFPSEILANIRQIDLWYNPFSCTCENYWFINWGNNNKKKLRYAFSRKYICNSPPRLNYRPMSWYNPTYMECHGLESYQISIVLVGSFLLVVLITAIPYRKYKWHLRYYIYLLRSKKEKYNIIPNDDFKYDAFVAYTSDDRSWVISNLMAVLEGQHNFSLCLHERDFLPGLTILDQIAETIKHSRKVILVLSNNFAKSQWCQYEILLAQHRFLEEGGNSLILILLSDIKQKYMTNCLGMLLRTMTYISWTENSEGKKLFWGKLIVSMKS
ncbi:hypothetical protein FSP39_021019 [Pinctada imbricata]|uniref:TIR domain-containing protein n=1 Tax=Pinctada imbricata TaxID=66713 RepID=A0AA88Y2X2_PINIB|nr:hypothetical protein FSP39_021019 [Pinctada imbricata]